VTKRGQPLLAVRAIGFHRSTAGLVLLLGAELLYLMLRFDTQRLSETPSNWAQLIGWSPQYLRISVAIVATIILLGGRRFVSRLHENGASIGRSRLPEFGVHLCAVVLFTRISAVVIDGDFSSLTHPAAWTLAWFLSGATMVSAWALTAFPLRSWMAAARVIWREIVLGVVAGTAVWATALVTQNLWTSLGRYTFYAVDWMLKLLYPTTISDPSRLVIGTPGFKVEISPECSGYEGVGLIVAFLMVYLWLFRRELRFPAAFILLPLGMSAIWLLNALRIVVLIVIGTSGWREIALGGFHSQAGWVAFNVIALGVAAIATHGGYFARSREPLTGGKSDGDPTTAYLAPLIAVLATAMVIGSISPVFEWLYPVRVLVVGAVLWHFRRGYRDLRWRFSVQAVAIGTATFVLWMMLLPDATAGKDGWPTALNSVPWYAAATWLVIRLAGYIVLAPISEELAFRGFLLRRFIHPDFQSVPIGRFSWLSFVSASLLFGALHGRLWVAGTVAGMLFAVALYRRRSFGDAVLAHATTNGLIALYVFATGRWSVWS